MTTSVCAETSSHLAEFVSTHAGSLYLISSNDFTLDCELDGSLEVISTYKSNADGSTACNLDSIDNLWSDLILHGEDSNKSEVGVESLLSVFFVHEVVVILELSIEFFNRVVLGGECHASKGSLAEVVTDNLSCNSLLFLFIEMSYLTVKVVG